jgi:formiminotetrahydrofolate cyclodeaminase
MELALKCAKHANVNAISDAMSGFAMSRAALTAAGYNVRINIKSLGEVSSSGGRMLKDLVDLEQKADKLEKEIQSVMKERGGV